jgi:hypothetical protein
MKVVIDGVEYIPKAEVLPITDDRLQKVLEILTSMRYFHENHKMMCHTYEALKVLSPEIAALEPDVAYSRIHGEEDE